MKIILILLSFILLSGCNQKEIEMIQKNNGYTIREISKIEAYKFDDLYAPILCDKNTVCIKGIDSKYYKMNLENGCITEIEGYMEFNPIRIPEGSERNRYIKNEMMHSLYSASIIVHFPDFEILNEISIDKNNGYKEIFIYQGKNNHKVLLEFETSKEIPMLSQYFYYDEIRQDIYLTYPKENEIEVYQFMNQEMKWIDKIDYHKEGMNYVSSRFVNGKRLDEYESDNQKRFYIDGASFEFSKDYDVELCKDYIFAFSKYETDKIIDYTSTKEYLFESDLSLDYQSYWNDGDPIQFMAYDTKKNSYVYLSYENQTLTSYELPFNNYAVVFKVDVDRYGFIVLSDDMRMKTTYLFEMEK